MITFTEIGKYGRLGNQLFQYAFLIGVSRKFDLPICLPHSFTSNKCDGQVCLLNNFNLKYKELNPFNPLDFTSHRREIELIDNDIFDTYNPKNIEDVESGTNFFGLYQSYKYWIDYEEEVKFQLQIKDKNVKKTAINKIEELRDHHKVKSIIAIHIRRGDLSGSIDYHVEYKKYLKRVLTNIDYKNTLFVIFTGGGRVLSDDMDDIKWCKSFFSELPNYIINDSCDPIQDFELIKNCDEIILGYVSTFAWWAAFLSEKVVYTPRLFNVKDRIRLSYYPDSFNI